MKGLHLHAPSRYRHHMEQRRLRRRRGQPLQHEPEAVIFARERAGLSQAQLAEMTGVARSLITRIESGTRNASPAMIRRIAEALNCPVVILERKRPLVLAESDGNEAA